MNERVNAEASTPDLSRAQWHKSSYSNGQANCVEVTTNLPGVMAVRDSKNPDGGVLRVSREDWRAFLSNIKCTR